MRIIYKIDFFYNKINDLFKLLIKKSNIINIFLIIIVQIEKTILKKITITLFKFPNFDRIYKHL